MKATLIDNMGSDLTVVNAARASFGAKVETLGPKDENLIRYLARGCPAKEFNELVGSFISYNPLERDKVIEALNNYRGTSTHWVPFAHCQLTFELSMPIFVARQLIRHTIGVSISEMSRRYVSENPEYWTPGEDGWRLAAANVKQGSSDQTSPDGFIVEDLVKDYCDKGTQLYRRLVDEFKVAPELARILLPINAYTDWTWTISLVTAARICHQRLDAHAQKEIRDLIQMVHDACMEKYPVSFKALMDFGAEG